LFKFMAGIDMVRIVYKGGGPTLAGVMSGEAQVLIGSAAAVMPQIKSGKLKALAVTSAKSTALAPGLPTIADSGVPGYEATAMDAIYAPAKTPPAIIRRLNQEIVRVITSPDVKEKFFNVGLEVIGSTPEQLEAAVKREISVWGKVIKDAGIRAD
jgi:tripartite-type tricarboxylate transporter receptor subunit TctC